MRSKEIHSQTRHDLHLTLAICGSIVAIVWFVFYPTLHARFLNYDDNVYVYNNPKITNGISFSSIDWAFTHVHADNWHPLTTISHMLDVQMFGLDPWGHHLTNVLLHALAAICLFFALKRLTAPSARYSTLGAQPSTIWACAFVAALFAVHPLRVESVAWVSERKDVLSGVFFMLTLWAYADYAQSKRGRTGKYLLVLVLFAIGLMCKPTIVTLPFVLLLLDYWPLGRVRSAKSEARGLEITGHRLDRTKRAASTSQRLNVSTSLSNLVVEKLPLFFLSAASCVATVIAQREAFEAMRRLTFQERFANAVVSYAVYLGQIIYPAHLTPLNPYSDSGLTSLAVISCLAGLWIVTIMFFIWRRQFPFLLTGWLWYLGMLVPMIGLVQVGWQARADRYTYLSQIGLMVLLTWAAIALSTRWRTSRSLLSVTAVAVLGLFATLARAQTAFWKDSATLWQHAIEVNPANYIAHNNLGNVIMADGHLEEAIRHFQTAIAANGYYAEARYNLGNAFATQRRFGEAIAAFQGAIGVRPSFYQAHNNMGCMYLNLGKTDEAIAQFNDALRIHPDYQEAHLNLGQLLTRLGRDSDAKTHFAEAERLKATQGTKKEVSDFAVAPR